MGDSSLRAKLAATDLTPPAIQASASGMLKMYNNPSLAVSEWRNVLQSCRTSQLLPLMYVANEVLQTSKRNRGNKFLESFSEVLPSALKFICERDVLVTEKVRRTAKIWGDRRVFSLRFVGELLAGLEEYRNGGKASSAAPATSVSRDSNIQTVRVVQQQQNQANLSAKVAAKTESDDDDLFGPNDDDDNYSSDGNAIGDDDNDAFIGNSGPSLLNVSNFSVDRQAVQSHSTRRSAFGAAGMKRRRSQTSPSSKTSKAGRRLSDSKKKNSRESPSRKKSKSVNLSTSSFVEQIHQLSDLDSQYQSISNIISSITSSDLFVSDGDIQEVGDELTDLHTKVNEMAENVKNQRKSLCNVADGKKSAEVDLKRYLIWMQGALASDEDELKLCDTLEEKLGLLQVVHADAKRARDEKRVKEVKDKALADAAAKKKVEDEELKRSLEKIQHDGPKDGMVWNKQTREYQYVDTEESWRD
mmetsp:Transcript_18901/g.28732  ORF Transcript_18901/g.28732 Transcript_18901/m.28732 type:complete len:472 (+) Transcript_18901:157-1572(+)